MIRGKNSSFSELNLGSSRFCVFCYELICNFVSKQAFMLYKLELGTDRRTYGGLGLSVKPPDWGETSFTRVSAK